jgi:hypothetical protein
LLDREARRSGTQGQGKGTPVRIPHDEGVCKILPEVHARCFGQNERQATDGSVYGCSIRKVEKTKIGTRGLKQFTKEPINGFKTKLCDYEWEKTNTNYNGIRKKKSDNNGDNKVNYYVGY